MTKADELTHSEYAADVLEKSICTLFQSHYVTAYLLQTCKLLLVRYYLKQKRHKHKKQCMYVCMYLCYNCRDEVDSSLRLVGLGGIPIFLEFSAIPPLHQQSHAYLHVPVSYLLKHDLMAAIGYGTRVKS